MALTPQGSWAASPPFGLRDFLEQSRARPEKIQQALGEVNRALRGLGVLHYRAVTITPESMRGEEVGRWVVTLESVDEPGKTLRWGDGGN